MLVFADEVVMEKEIVEFIGYDGFEYLAGCACQGYWPIVAPDPRLLSIRLHGRSVFRKHFLSLDR